MVSLPHKHLWEKGHACGGSPRLAGLPPVYNQSLSAIGVIFYAKYDIEIYEYFHFSTFNFPFFNYDYMTVLISDRSKLVYLCPKRARYINRMYDPAIL